MHDIAERRALSVSGYWIILLVVALLAIFGPGMLLNPLVPINAAVVLVAIVMLPGFYLIEPNTARVLTFLGNYAGTDSRAGLRWTIPILIGREKVSLRLRNFENAKSKVNDANGNPIEIAGVIVWRVTRPAASVFGVEDTQEFVAMQGEAAIRGLASAYPYGGARDKAAGGLTLLGHPVEIAEALRSSLQDRVGDAGVQIVEARLTHLAYAPEIAAAMLQRQQADALLDAREVIVEGAVGLVQTALKELESRDIVTFTPEDKARLVSNLMVVLSGEQSAQPILSAGS